MLKDKINFQGERIYKSLKIFIILVAVGCFLLVGILVTNASVNYKYANVYLPGTRLGSVDIGSLTYEQAKKKIQGEIDIFNHQGFVYVGQDKTTTIYPIVNSGSADSSFPLLIWYPEKSLEKIFRFQKDESFNNLLNKLSVMVGGKTWHLEYTWDKERHLGILEEGFWGLLPAKKEASFQLDADNKLQIEPELIGQTFTYDQAMIDTEEQIQNLKRADIALISMPDKPMVTVDLIEKFRAQITEVAQQTDLLSQYDNEQISIKNSDWRQWLQIKFNKNKPYLGFDVEKIKKYFDERGLSEDIEVLVQDAKFKLSDGKVSEFTESREGRVIDWLQTTASAEKILTHKVEYFDIVVETIQPKLMNSDVNDLGIGTLLGTGESDFKGSPPNRVHNIGIGATTLNGLLINPGEEFSLITALGEIDGESGYKQELVIKGNRTIPEYGGGLCQIGTTVFRAALSTGLPIKERRNHSYRVSYYEPAGMDATIYDPKPDLRFMNDTGNYILIQTRIEDTKIYFDFWGTSDGRIATTTKPIVYNLVAPPPRKEIKTTDLKPGQKKCTESAHTGADTRFDYSVLYPGQSEAKKETFYSHYIPWQEVCLVGVTQEELDAEKDSFSGGVASTTPTTTPLQ